MSEFWEKRAVILSAFGLVGFGALVGAGSVYYFYIRHKIKEHFQIQTTITSQIHQLRKEIENIKSTVTIVNEEEEGEKPVKKPIKRQVRFPSEGETTADEDEYVTASSEEDDESFFGFWTSAAKTKQETKIKPQVSEQENEADVHSVSESGDGQESQFLKDMDRMLGGNVQNQHEAYKTLKINQDKLTHSCEFWWRLAKASHMEGSIAGANGDKELKKSLLFSGFTCAEKSLRLNDHSSEAHKWYAITLGSKGEFLSVSEKIQNGFIFKEHVDRAVELNPKDAALHHLLGRFCYEVSQLSWVERKIAATLFSAPPTSSPKEALNHFNKAEQIGTPFKENRLYIGKCYIALSDYTNAAKWLDMASSMPVVSSNDTSAQQQLDSLLPKYRKYLK